MNDSESRFKDWLSNEMPIFCKNNRDFDGNVRELDTYQQDSVCEAFFDFFPSWIDDVVPPCTIDGSAYLSSVYSDEEGDFSEDIRGDIYLYIESKIDELMCEVWAEYSNDKPEPFAGYEVGQ